MKRNLLLWLLQLQFGILILLPLIKADTTPVDVTAYNAPIRVACVGDSITNGFGLKRDAGHIVTYPQQLQAMLGDKWNVQNFGFNGATLMNGGDIPYQKQLPFQPALKFNPDVVVIMLGTNDSSDKNWGLKANFVADYKDMISKFQALAAKPRIYIAYPIPLGPGAAFHMKNNSLKEEQPLIDQVVTDTGVGFIDLYAPLDGKWDLYRPDQIHPDLPGATIIAKTVYKALTGQDYTGPDVATPVAPAAAPTPNP